MNSKEGDKANCLSSQGGKYSMDSSLFKLWFLLSVV